MKLKILLVLVFTVFLIGNVSAITIASEWSDQSQSVVINDGDNIDFRADFGSSNPPITFTIQLIDSTDTVIYTFESNTVDAVFYSNTYNVNQSVYGTNGSYEVEITASDQIGSASHRLYLIVNAVSPVNNAPSITTTPVTSVDEEMPYVYDVDATDPDAGDTLTYSFTQAPAWISINSGTGLITGTAPTVASDTNYGVTVQVSDGTDTDSQSYTLTVNNVVVDTTPPSIVIVFPVQSVEYNTVVSTLQYSITDPNLESCWYSTNNGANNQTLNCAQGFEDVIAVEGSNTWNVYANDSFGNENSASVTFTINTTGLPDTTPPAVTITYPTSTTYASNITTMTFTISDPNLDVCWYSVSNGATNQSMNCSLGYVDVNSTEGSNTWTIYANDTAGNENSDAVTFTVQSNFTDTTPPTITIVSPLSATYRTSQIFFEITVDETALAWFNLDGGPNITMNDGSGLRFYYTLTGVSDGTHTANFYAVDGSGNLASSSVTFEVDTSTQKKKKGGRNDGSSKDIPLLLENEFEGAQYLSQSDVTPSVIILGDDTRDARQEVNVFVKIWQSIADFFKRLFGF